MVLFRIKNLVKISALDGDQIAHPAIVGSDAGNAGHDNIAKSTGQGILGSIGIDDGYVFDLLHSARRHHGLDFPFMDVGDAAGKIGSHPHLGSPVKLVPLFAGNGNHRSTGAFLRDHAFQKNGAFFVGKSTFQGKTTPVRIHHLDGFCPQAPSRGHRPDLTGIQP